MIEQTRFLGASVKSFTNNLGWSESASTLNVGLVEDLRIGDAFNFPSTGSPTSFQFNGWRFDGIIQSYQSEASDSGNLLYTVTLQDPREVLDGVQLILGGYTGVGLTNILNVYGYLENISFGNSGKNEAGIKYGKIKDALAILLLGGSSYGGPIKLAGYQYFVDLSQLPNLPEYYRIPNDNISLLEFIRMVCDDASHDFFFRMTYNTPVCTITLHTVNKNFQPTIGAISSFINSLDNVSTKNFGMEFTNDVTSKFLIGGKVSRMYLQTASGGEDNDLETNVWENTIWPYWGLDNSGDIILGEGLYDEHTFLLNIKPLEISELEDDYYTDVGEMRAALTDMDAWLSYLQLHNNNKYRFETGSTNEQPFINSYRPYKELVLIKYERDDDIFYTGVLEKDSQEYQDALDQIIKNGFESPTLIDLKYNASTKYNPHFGKADRLQYFGSMLSYLVGPFLYGQAALANFTPNPASIKVTKKIHKKTKLNDQHEAENHPNTLDPVVVEQIEQQIIRSKQERLYNFIKGIADQYYGLQFMVKLPIIQSAPEAETGSIDTSFEPRSEGFLTEDEYETSAEQNLVPIQFIDGDPNLGYIVDPRFISEEGKLYAYCRFDGFYNWDYSNIDASSLVFNEAYQSVFIKCEVESYFVYRDKNTLSDPRAIIKLPGRVIYRATPEDNIFAHHIVGNFLYPKLKQQVGADQAKLDVQKLIEGSPGSDMLNLFQSQYAVWPHIVAIGLESNIHRYGPWYSTGAEGKVEYEQDDTLVPWNFSSWTELNNTANSKVNQALNLYQTSENGTISFPGVPNLNAGDNLIAGGPIVTNISVSVDNSIMTTYQMATWKHHPYKLSKHKNDYIARLSKKNRQIVRDNANKIARSQDLKKEFAGMIYKAKRAQDQISSSHDIMSANADSPPVIQPSYNTAAQLNEDYVAVSLDTMYQPVHMYSSDSPKYPFYNIEHEDPNIVRDIGASGLNPFRAGSRYEIIANTIGQTDAIDGSYNWDEFNMMSLRAPLILTGFGKAIDGTMVPASGDTNAGKYTFHQDYLYDKTLWKTGPLDARWDETRKVWSSTIPIKLVEVTDTGEEWANVVKVKPLRIRIQTSDGDPVAISGMEVDHQVRVDRNINDEEFLAINPRFNYLMENIIYTCFYIDGVWVVDNPSVFQDLRIDDIA